MWRGPTTRTGGRQLSPPRPEAIDCWPQVRAAEIGSADETHMSAYDCPAMRSVSAAVCFLIASSVGTACTSSVTPELRGKVAGPGAKSLPRLLRVDANLSDNKIAIRNLNTFTSDKCYHVQLNRP